MQIRAVYSTTDSQGLPANGYAYHIGLPNENPVNNDNKVTVIDANTGNQTSNPFYIDSFGRFINNNGQLINPTAEVESYSVVVLSPEGGVFMPMQTITSDNIAPSGLQASVVDATINSLNNITTGAKFLDLSAFETIYVSSLNSGWEDSLAGPLGGFYAHRDGTTDVPNKSTGDETKFYDSVGTGFTRDPAQRFTADAALSEDTTDNKLSVKVDGATIEINGSNELQAIGASKALVYLTSPIATPIGTITIDWDAESYDDAAFWDIASPSKIVIPVGYSSVRISFFTPWAANAISGGATITATSSLLKNGVTTDYLGKVGDRETFIGSAGSEFATISAATPWIDVIGGTDYFEVSFTNTGHSGSLASTSIAGGGWFMIEARA